MKIKAYGQKIEKKPGRISYIPVLKEIEITKIKNTARSRGQCGYFGYCPNYFDEFPEDDPNDRFNNGGWCHFIKAHQSVKIPVVPMGEMIELKETP